MAKKPKSKTPQVKKSKSKTPQVLMAEYIYEFAYYDFMSKINGRDGELLDEETLIVTRAAACFGAMEKRWRAERQT